MLCHIVWVAQRTISVASIVSSCIRESISGVRVRATKNRERLHRQINSSTYDILSKTLAPTRLQPPRRAVARTKSNRTAPASPLGWTNRPGQSVDRPWSLLAFSCTSPPLVFSSYLSAFLPSLHSQNSVLLLLETNKASSSAYAFLVQTKRVSQDIRCPRTQDVQEWMGSSPKVHAVHQDCPKRSTNEWRIQRTSVIRWSPLVMTWKKDLGRNRSPPLVASRVEDLLRVTDRVRE